MALSHQQQLLDEIKHLKSLLVAKQHDSTSKSFPSVIRKAPKGPSRSWRNPALIAPPAPVVPILPPAPVSTKILVNPNFKGNKILVNPNFQPSKKILVNPAFQQPKAIHVNPKMLSKPQSPKVLNSKSPRVIFKSKNKLIMKRQLSTPGKTKTAKVSPLIFKSKNKLVRRTTDKKIPAKILNRSTEKRKSKQGQVTVIEGEQFVRYGSTRLTRLLSIKKQVMQRSLSTLANKKRRSLLPCPLFRKLGYCPRGDACENSHSTHSPPKCLFKNRVLKKDEKAAPSQASLSQKMSEKLTKKKDSRYYQSEEQGESEAMRPQRNKTVGELPSFIPL